MIVSKRRTASLKISEESKEPYDHAERKIYFMKLAADLHVHTIASTHAYSTITEIARHAADIGLSAVAITDHGIALEDSPHIWHFEIMKSLPRELFGVRLLMGVEANVQKGGTLDMPERILKQLDWVVASMHKSTAVMDSPADVTEAWLKVIDNPLVDLLGHIGTPRYVCDYEAVVKACAEKHKLIEINANTFRVRPESAGNCRKVAELCRRYEVPVCVDSDAHFHLHVGQPGGAGEMLEEIGFPEELILNASYDRLLAYLQNRPSR